ncbi:peptidyl-prolyl cis-trans isomerase B (cyclophilin B) [Ekhidna lutea]|uniref:Peptidyl-prolyl cis-trans isomerase n=1 Tax=Ekhidna lutea TaxID=447679 RepID=A0A239EYL0_EKHLU|nr:peptidylprolyl isomerase [Ekhidna lutea]SNS49685.1 peptidyl-prolyl cis-trans isomerase B (cyclophilin B) [Ekhidna lutea]
MKKILISLLILALFAGCGDKNKDYLVKIKTKYGDMTVVLYDETPLHKKNFLELANSGRYDSTTFHRIVEDFMIQGGNVAEKENIREKEEDRIPAEIVDGIYHTKGSLAAARQGDASNPEKKSSASQFYIIDGMSWEFMTTDVRQLNQRMSALLQDTAYSDLLKQFQDLAQKRDNAGMTALSLANKELVEEKYNIDLSVDPSQYADAYHGIGGYPPLDGEYTVFGKVVDGLDVIDKLAAIETKRNPASGEKSLPLEDVYLTMEVIEMKKKEVTEKFGYTYSEE